MALTEYMCVTDKEMATNIVFTPPNISLCFSFMRYYASKVPAVSLSAHFYTITRSQDV